MSISRRLRFEVFRRDNFTCQYCGAKPPDTVLEVDHRHPRSKGGRDNMENLTTSCISCNRGKSAVLIPRPILLDVGPERIPGPRNGESVQRVEQFPAYWVFEAAGVYELYEDELDADLWFTKWEAQLKWGHPGMRYNRGHHHDVTDRWNARYELDRSDPRRLTERHLAGFYLPIMSGNEAIHAIYWLPGAQAMEYVIHMGTHLYESEGDE